MRIFLIIPDIVGAVPLNFIQFPDNINKKKLGLGVGRRTRHKGYLFDFDYDQKLK